MKINCIIDSSIHLNPNDLPKEILGDILDYLTIDNPAKKLAHKEMLWGAKDIPERIKLYKYNSHNELVLPRGFRFVFEAILYRHNIFWDESGLEADDNYLYDIDEISLREYQNKAVNKLILMGFGIYKASTGSGKTRAMLELARRLHQKTIVVCEKIDIAHQWENTAFELGFGPCSVIADGEFDGRTSLVIALRQSLWNSSLPQEWFNQWGTFIVDESHHCSAETMFELAQRFPAYYRFGCSATPDSDEDLFPIARAVLGPVVAESTPEEIGEHLVIPSVKVIKTEFEYLYRPTERLKNGRVQRNNYGQMMAALEKDSQRNSEIMCLAMNDALDGHHCLIISDRKNHLEEIFNHYPEELFSTILYADPLTNYFKLTGDNSDESDTIKNQIEKSNVGTITFSTLAKEGTDIPRWDRLFLAYPGRKLRGFEQAIGRIMRPHPGKEDAIVYDFRDELVPLLNSQYRDRAQQIYNKKEYNVE